MPHELILPFRTDYRNHGPIVTKHANIYELKCRVKKTPHNVNIYYIQWNVISHAQP